MNAELIHQTVTGTFSGDVSFPQVVSRLNDEGVEWYSANLFFRASTHYAPDGEHVQTLWPAGPGTVADRFDGDGVVSAIRASQRREIVYPQFLEQIAQAGVAYYTVHLRGEKAIYFGRHGEFHIEEFPKAVPVNSKP